MENFREELQVLINRHSMENDSNTPDFILADYLQECLETFDKALQAREQWYGRTEIESDISFEEQQRKTEDIL